MNLWRFFVCTQCNYSTRGALQHLFSSQKREEPLLPPASHLLPQRLSRPSGASSRGGEGEQQHLCLAGPSLLHIWGSLQESPVRQEPHQRGRGAEGQSSPTMLILQSQSERSRCQLPHSPAQPCDLEEAISPWDSVFSLQPVILPILPISDSEDWRKGLRSGT
jgi:hypothetical protein